MDSTVYNTPYSQTLASQAYPAQTDYKTHATVAWVVAGLLLAVLIIALIWWAVSGKKDYELEADNVDFTITHEQIVFDPEDENFSSNIKATWTGTRNDSDKLQLFASNGPLNFNKEGEVIGDFSTSGFADLVYQTHQVDASVKEAVITGAPVKTGWSIALVITNPNVKGFRQYNYHGFTAHEPASGSVLNLTSLGQTGSVRVTEDGDVHYNQATASTTNNDVFAFHENVLCLSSSRCTNGDGYCGSRAHVLYDDNGTLHLGRRDEVDVTASTWEYNKQGKNRWCLKADPSKCMSYQQGIEPHPVPTTVNVGSSGSTWSFVTLE